MLRDLVRRAAFLNTLLTTLLVLFGCEHKDLSWQGVLDEKTIVANPDERNAVALPFTLYGRQTGLDHVTLQWRRKDEPFPDPPEQTCTEVARCFGGIALAPPPGFDRSRQIRLPELADSASWLEGSRAFGRILEIFRPSRVPEPVLWDTTDLMQPAAVLAIGDGSAALVLDSVGETWRARRVGLATGFPMSLSATGSGIATAMALDPEGRYLFVASRLNDRDGMDDLAYADSDGSRLVLLPQHSSGWHPDSIEPVSLGDDRTTNLPRAIAAADLDGDGLLDLLGANERSATVTGFLQPHAGWRDTKSPSFTLGGPAGTPGVRCVGSADLNNDRRLDIFSANPLGDSITIFFHPGAGFSNRENPSVTLTDAVTLRGPVSAVAADLNGDGLLDLASANEQSDTLTVFLQPESGWRDTGTASLTLGGPESTGGPVSIVAADLNADGLLDLLSANIDGNSVSLFTQVSQGQFPVVPTRMIGGETVTASPCCLAVADINLDGELDIATANRAGRTLTLFLAGVGDR